MSHAKRLIKMPTSHCCRVFFSTPFFKLPFKSWCFAVVGRRIKTKLTFYALIWSIFDFVGQSQDAPLLTFPHSLSPQVLCWQTDCHFIDYRTFQVFLECDKEINRVPFPFRTLFFDHLACHEIIHISHAESNLCATISLQRLSYLLKFTLKAQRLANVNVPKVFLTWWKC